MKKNIKNAIKTAVGAGALSLYLIGCGDGSNKFPDKIPNRNSYSNAYNVAPHYHATYLVDMDSDGKVDAIVGNVDGKFKTQDMPRTARYRQHFFENALLLTPEMQDVASQISKLHQDLQCEMDYQWHKESVRKNLAKVGLESKVDDIVSKSNCLNQNSGE